MIIESILVMFFALVLDFAFGDPKNKFHPTAWLGSLIAKLTPYAKNSSENLEKLGGVFIIVVSSGIVVSLMIFLNIGIKLITADYLYIIISVIGCGILLKTTIAIKRGSLNIFLPVLTTFPTPEDSALGNKGS